MLEAAVTASARPVDGGSPRVTAVGKQQYSMRYVVGVHVSAGTRSKATRSPEQGGDAAGGGGRQDGLARRASVAVGRHEEAQGDGEEAVMKLPDSPQRILGEGGIR